MTHPAHDAPRPAFAPVTATIDVPVDPATAFRLYVSRPGRLHPAQGQCGEACDVVYEPFPGGRWYERGADAREYDWGRILVWDPPRSLVLDWMVNSFDGEWRFDPDPANASRAEITFEPITAGTRVQVVHTDLDNHQGGAAHIHRGVTRGWRQDLQDLHRAALTDNATASKESN